MALLFSSILALVFSAGIALSASEDLADPSAEEPGTLHWLEVERDGRVSGRTRVASTTSVSTVKPPTRPRYRPTPSEKLSPVVKTWLKTRSPDEHVELVVTFNDDFQFPPLPDLGSAESRDRPTRRSAVIENIQRERIQSQRAFLRGLPIKAKEHFWIVNSVAGVARLADVAVLADSPNVVYLQPVRGNEPPPNDSNPSNNPDNARNQLSSDLFFAALPQMRRPMWIGLFDSGVRPTHVLLNRPRRIDWFRDTVQGDEHGRGGDPLDRIDHGTASAAILSGTDSLGQAYRGVTPYLVDSWKVYETTEDGGGFPSTPAVLRAVQAGIAGFEAVMVAQLQVQEQEFGAIAQAFDHAFDVGVVVVAANGNTGPVPRSVTSPALAHKVLGIGAVNVETGIQYANQSSGPAPDGRIKPDVQAPTDTETASSASDAALRVFARTSGATPYAGGIAALSRRWLGEFGFRYPGYTYAWMVLGGQAQNPYSNQTGAGPLWMPVNRSVGIARFDLHHSEVATIPLSVGPGRRHLEVAVWWPEVWFAPHNRISVSALGPNGVVRATGDHAESVFQTIRVNGPVDQGVWRITLRGMDVPTARQTVYVAVSLGR